MSTYQSLNKSATHNRSNNSDWRLFLRLLPYARRSGQLLTVALVLLIPIALASAVQPLLIGQVISLIRNEPSTYDFLKNRPLWEGLNILQVLILLAITMRLVLTGVQGYLLQKLGQKITAAIREDLFHHVTSLAVRFFDRTPIGKLITRLTSDVEVLGDVFSTGAIGIVSNIFSMLVIIGIMLSIQWKLACLLLVMLLPITWLIIYFQQQYRKANYKGREELSALNSQLQENVVGINIVQLFRREKFNAELFRQTNKRYTQQVDQTIFYDSAVSATLEWIGLVAIAGVLLVGGWLLLGGSLTFGVLAAFILYAQRLFDPLRDFAEKFTVIQAGFTAIERITDILDEPIEIRDGNNPRFSIFDSSFGYIDEIISNLESQKFDSAPELGEIRFENVWFAYKDDDYVIKNLNFIIHPGEKVALVGPTGAGKSSIIRLLCRLYEPTKGRILLDGIDIRELPQADLRRYMAVILQEGFLFAGDVKSNITLGDHYTLEEIQQAASKTNIAEFIEQLPQGYDTQLRQRGTNISSGQKQLLAFARAAIRNPQILVLDEATASLDVSTETLVQEALNQLLVKRTAIIIAHRLSTIRNVNRIFVLKRGELIEEGTHEQLLHQGGLYATLHNLQMLGS
ncbi:ABC transporter ATP-binding protein [Umezakia ovalisporum]|jgi:ATP-binding cassette subfamily B protein|uniref:ABC transporter ATP-binding protein/permease n=2 Tax=Umezakia ovalisporum TaxID=75695 RepID=A0AA43KG56_9CYAN|nr:ABC transporter ATP-binding protein [Umezakia ovalisporum]MDH6058262.1 ABC transporter ATP-binding protein/permease [Umezakia ovalisporum FSS-43]MDH6065654.1 ABC transporter ATP-binding protein/permease [Umezakia ovalisporum FSS-62]MDH6068562.1 ABC transporter ATP-binding protein/permease [Umezakia ovalisporum APH033B]MDH6071351.1 ABC transporter ATP-binding protein/permease [Umezakia ovalisporum CobakiLakeA]MDH6076539.1 ABC transporter ATP-binding protein/permease [Umezakia ovalisporum FSS